MTYATPPMCGFSGAQRCTDCAEKNRQCYHPHTLEDES